MSNAELAAKLREMADATPNIWAPPILRMAADRLAPVANPGAPAITINKHAHGDDHHG